MFRFRSLVRTISVILFFTAMLIVFYSTGEADERVDGCQCTDFIYRQRPDIPILMGHAKDWLYSARVHRIPYDRMPQVGDVAVFLRGEFGFSAYYGHVALVIDVNESMDQFSIAGWDGLKADCRLEIVLDLPVTYNTYFIHHKDSVKIQTSSLEQWIAFAEEQDGIGDPVKDTCEDPVAESAWLTPRCTIGATCCADPAPSQDSNHFQSAPISLPSRVDQLHTPLQ